MNSWPDLKCRPKTQEVDLMTTAAKVPRPARIHGGFHPNTPSSSAT